MANKRFTLPILGLLISLSLLGQDKKPNILLILSDDHSLPHLGSYGDENCKRFNITPYLDAFAEEGIRFNRAYTTAPQCAPSRISIFTGQAPIELGVSRFAQPSKNDVPFFTDLLRENGYWVGLEGRHHHLDGKVRDAEHIVKTLEELGMKRLEERFDYVNIASTKNDLSQTPSLFSSALDRIPEGQPFFLYFGFNQPHRKWTEEHEGIDPDALKLPSDFPDLPEVREDYARFLNQVRDLDRGFGQICEILKEQNLDHNTIIIFMGDNGEALLRGKGTLYQRGLNVPLLVRWDEHIRAGVSDDLISGIDLAPTILEAAGINSGSEMKGKSFLPELLGQKDEEQKYVFAERGWHAGDIRATDGLDLSRSVTSDTYSYIYNALPNRTYTPVDMPKTEAWKAIVSAHENERLDALFESLYFKNPRPIFELYNIKEDPFQLNNLSGKEKSQAIEKQLRTELEKWMIQQGDFLPLPSDVIKYENK